MIIWINGAFGAGKTQTAYTLQRRMPDAYVYDPENAGCFIRKNLPPALHTDDFQDYPMWRAVTLEMLTYLAKHHAGDIIVPMTITNRAYYEEIIGTLSKEYALRHYILYAQEETIRRRLASRLEGPLTRRSRRNGLIQTTWMSSRQPGGLPRCPASNWRRTGAADCGGAGTGL